MQILHKIAHNAIVAVKHVQEVQLLVLLALLHISKRIARHHHLMSVYKFVLIIRHQII